MLRGIFLEPYGRPYIEGRLIIPRLNIRTRLFLCIDTGADRSILMPFDSLDLGLDYQTLNAGSVISGIGGAGRNFAENALLAFSDGASDFLYELDLLIAAPNPAINNIPSILGRDILNRWRITYDYPARTLTFDVLSADFTFPL